MLLICVMRTALAERRGNISPIPLTNFVSLLCSFIKERGQIEADYAKSLRRLVKRYSPKEAPRPTEEEFSHIRGYKQVRRTRQSQSILLNWLLKMVNYWLEYTQTHLALGMGSLGDFSIDIGPVSFKNIFQHSTVSKI